MEFFYRFLMVSMAIALTSCTVFRPDIPDRFPGGYSRLIHAVPECSKPDSATYLACMTAAEIYEQSDPQKATWIFIQHWQKTVWEGKSISEGIEDTKHIVIPALAFIYDIFPGEYSTSMHSELDRVLLDSLTSFDSFSYAHTRAASQNP